MTYFGKKEEPSGLEIRAASTSSSITSGPDTEKNGVRCGINQIDAAVEKKLVRKLDWQVTSLLAVIYGLSFLDRSNIGNARIAGMAKDLKLTSNKYEWLLTIFYIAYITCSFQGFMWRVVKPHQWLAFVVFGWGVVSTCQAAAQSWAGMMVLRFLLGMFESGYSPSIAFLLSFYYNRSEIGFRIGIWGCAAPLASTFAGALAYGITSGHSKLANWRLLFLVEGLPTIIAAGFAYFFLPDNQSQARFLTEEEREVAKLRIEKQFGKTEVDKTKGGYKLGEIWETFLDPISWCTASMYFCVNVSFAAIPVFLPTIIAEMGFTSVNAQGLSAPPYFVCIFSVLFTTWLADRTQQRGLIIAALSTIGAAGYLVLALCKSVGARYAGVFLAINGGFCAIAVFLPWVVNNQGTVTRRGMGVVIMNFAGQCGPLLGTRVFPLADAPRYVKGQSICAGFLILNAVIALVNRTYMAYRNRRFDEMYGPVSERVVGGDASGEDAGDENYGRNFRYVL